MTPTRRQFVKAGGVAAVLSATGLAGCNALGGGDGGGGGGSPEDWQYDPSTLGSSPNVMFGSFDYGTLYDMRDQLPESMASNFELEGNEDLDVSASDFDQMVGVAGGDISMQSQSYSMFGSAAITGSFDKSAVTDSVDSGSDVNEVGDYEGFTLYEVPDIGETAGTVGGQTYEGSGTIGAGDGAMVVGVSVADSGAEVTGRETVETMIDASNGNATLISAGDGPATDLQGRIGDSVMAVGAEVDTQLVTLAGTMAGQSAGGGGFDPSQFLEGLRAGGLGADIDGETTTYDFVLVYDSADAAESAGVDGLVGMMASDVEDQQGVNDVSSSRDGAAVTISISGDTETLLEQGQSAGSSFSAAPPAF